jgi:hypothetical protein
MRAMRQTSTCEHRAVPLLIALAVAIAGGVLGYLRLARPLEADPAARAALAEAVAAVDRELAGNLELMSMFDQTKQPVVLENGEFARNSAALQRGAPPSYAVVADLYARIADTEAAMERRGPANTIKDADRKLIEAWEGDARAAQRSLREALAIKPLSGHRAAIARLGGSR